MATVDGLTKARMLAIEAASVVDGHIDIDGHLILTRYDETEIDAGSALPALPNATYTQEGIVELATDAEAIAGVDIARAITPYTLAAAVGTLVPDATTSVKGKVELATTTEATTGTDTVRAVTPEGLKAAIDAALATFLSTKVYPVGSYYVSDVSTSPDTVLGFGTWSAVEGRMLIGADGTYTAGSEAGAANKTLSTAEIPSHSHGVGTLTMNSTGDHTHDIARDNDGATGSAEKTLHSTGITSGYDDRYTNQLWPAGAHAHTISGSTATAGSGNAFSLLNPYRAVYIWHRTA